MNIFYTYNDPVLAAQSLPDKLVVKMPLESAQMLCTTQRYYFHSSYCDQLEIYKTAYLNHPCTIWARESLENYNWLQKHFVALCDEYTYRYGKVHASDTKLRRTLSYIPASMPSLGLTPIAQAMPDQYKNADPVVAYRNYLINEKHYAAWNKARPKPNWWNTSWQVEDCA